MIEGFDHIDIPCCCICLVIAILMCLSEIKSHFKVIKRSFQAYVKVIEGHITASFFNENFKFKNFKYFNGLKI